MFSLCLFFMLPCLFVLLWNASSDSLRISCFMATTFLLSSMACRCASSTVHTIFHLWWCWYILYFWVKCFLLPASCPFGTLLCHATVVASFLSAMILTHFFLDVFSWPCLLKMRRLCSLCHCCCLWSVCLFYIASLHGLSPLNYFGALTSSVQRPYACVHFRHFH